ncbi:MAG: ATP-binding protein [Gemmataceae bacterium]
MPADLPAQHAPLPKRVGILLGVGLVAFHLAHLLAGPEEGLWLPALGIGFVLTAWLDLRVVPLLAIDAILARLMIRENHSILQVCCDGLLFGAQVGVSWWAYDRVAKGARRLEDPRSATVFLIVVPGLVAALFALAQALEWRLADVSRDDFGSLIGALWISRILGLLTLAPFLLVGVTPIVVRLRMTRPEPKQSLPGGAAPDDWTIGEALETAGLCLGSGILTTVLVAMKAEGGSAWTLWGLSLLLVVWASLRQGLRGGALVALVGGVAALALATHLGLRAATFSPLQGNILAQCSTALLVGASAGWIRASEARYRQVVGQIPVVLYSVRLPRGHFPHTEQPTRAKMMPLDQAEVTLVSSAARRVFRCDPEELMGAYAGWLERVLPEDREILVAALAQLLMRNETIACEYRLIDAPAHEAKGAGAQEAGRLSNWGLRPQRWVRDTLAPNYRSDGAFEGWEGVVEDISEQRALSLSLRRTSNMFQALVSNLPTGVFFVQGPSGQPILVNARARQLLGQREENAAGWEHLSKVYRLYRPDGSEYPANELPVARALNEGATCGANDIVVHRPDGRRIPLITWAAPVNLGGGAAPDAAVWVLEDLTALQHAEQARKESEARLRAVFDTMADGVVVQNQQGTILECNPAACAILGASRGELLERSSLGAGADVLREDGAPLPLEEQPDQRALRLGAPVRAVVMGLRQKDSATIRWLYVHAMPLAAGAALSPHSRGARLVTTFADLSALRRAQEELRRAQRLELVGRLASGALHDFNNLLTVMLGLTAMARSALPEGHAARHDLDRIEEVAEQAGHLAGQLLAFSKQKHRPPEPVDLNTVVVHALKILQSAIPASIRLERQVSGELFVLGDETQLKQVLMNLCLNAREAIADKGVITIGTAAEAPEDNGAPEKQGWVRLTVADTGSGMSDEVRARLFEPFFSTKERGVGLGLAVVQQIVEELGGRVAVQTEPGKGTRIDIWLRAARAR